MPEQPSESKKIHYNFGDSIGFVALIITVVTMIATPPIWLKMLLLIGVAICVAIFVLKSHWTHEWKKHKQWISAVSIVMLIGLISVPQLISQWRTEHPNFGFIVRYQSYVAWALVALLSFFVVRKEQQRSRKSVSPSDSDTSGHPVPLPKARTQEGWTELAGKLPLVTNRIFEYGEEIVDGKSYINCTFTHVNIYYDGTAPTSFSNCTFDKDTLSHFHTHNPGIAQWMETLRALGVFRPDLKFAINPLPEPESDENLKLRDRVHALGRELILYMKDKGPDPAQNKHYDGTQSLEEYFREVIGASFPWTEKVAFGFSAHFADRARKMRDELREYGVKDSELDNFVDNAPHGHGPGQIMGIAARLLHIAADMEMGEVYEIQRD